MRKVFVAVVALALLLVSFSTVFAAPPIKVQPWVYDPDNTGASVSKWVTGEGLPDAGKSNHALYLTKNAPTTANVASGASVDFSGTLSEFGVDYRNDGHCGAGAPRFNVYTEQGYYFFGCTYGVHTPVPNASGWTRVRFTDADAFPATDTPPFPGFGNVVVTGIEIIFDEGPGSIHLDNIDVNGTLVGKPGGAK